MVTERVDRRAHDEGFTVTELIVVLILMGIILAAAYSALQLTVRAREIQERNSFQATQMTAPIEIMDIAIAQNTLIEAGSTPYRLSCLTDRNMDGQRERHVFEATADGRLVETFSKVNATGQNIAGTERVTVWQRNETVPTRNINREKGTPMFTYIVRDANLGTVQELDYIRANQANEVLIRVAARHGVWEFEAERRIMLRNR